MKYFVANWKAHKNLTETTEWFLRFKEALDNNNKIIQSLQKNEYRIIICPPHPLIQSIHEEITALNLPNIIVGAQDLSVFEEGNYTGEVTAKNLEGLVTYVIVGHSERRQHAQENDEELLKKIQHARKFGIEPLLCIRGVEDAILPDVSIVVYEPVDAIGTGNTAKLEEILVVKNSLALPRGGKFFYGGSVNAQVIGSYLGSGEIDGYLIATASLDPASFVEILVQA